MSIIKKDILVLGKGPTQRVEHTLTAEKMYPEDFTVTRKVFCLSLHYSGANSYLFVNGKEIVKFKAKDSATVATRLCLVNIWKYLSVDNIKKTGPNGYVYEFSVDFDPYPVNINKSMPSIHRYFMVKYNIR